MSAAFDPTRWGRPLWRGDASGLDGKARHVARVLADRVDRPSGECRIRVALIAADTGLSDKTVRRALDDLEAAGHVVIRHARGASFYGLRGGPYDRPDDYQPGLKVGHGDRPSTPAKPGHSDRPYDGTSVTMTAQSGHHDRSSPVTMTGAYVEEESSSKESSSKGGPPPFPSRAPKKDWRPDVQEGNEAEWRASIAALAREHLPGIDESVAFETVHGIVKAGRATTADELIAHLRRWQPELLAEAAS